MGNNNKLIYTSKNKTTSHKNQKKKTKMEHQNWGDSYIFPKSTASNKGAHKEALNGKVTAISKGVKNQAYAATNVTAKKYAQAINSEDTHVETVSHDIKIAIMKGRQTKGYNQKQLAEAIMVKLDIVKDYESGKAIPDNGLIGKMERALGVKLPRVPKKKKN